VLRPSVLVELASLRSFFAMPEAAGQVREAGNTIAVRADDVGGPPLNRVVALDDMAFLDGLADFYEDRPFWVALEPESGLDDELAARGFVRQGAWQRFVRGVEPLLAMTELEISDARRPEDFAAVTATNWRLPPAAARWMAALHGRPGWHCFVAYLGSHAVGAAALFATDGVGWLGITSTLPSHRGRGAQSGLLAARIARAGVLGLHLLVTETDAPVSGEAEQSFRNVLRAGFEPEYVRPNFASPRSPLATA
jgi:GNAT superfamily N-acetyltransferase